MSGHTPGPWVVHSKVRAIVPLADAYKIVPLVATDCEPEDVAKTIALFADPRADMPEEETYANAFLMASAPAMLEALQEAKLALECAAGCNEGATYDVCESKIMSWAGSAAAVAYTRIIDVIARAAITSAQSAEQ